MCAVVSTVMTAKAKFKQLLERKFMRVLNLASQEQNNQLRIQRECLKAIDKC